MPSASPPDETLASLAHVLGAPFSFVALLDTEGRVIDVDRPALDAACLSSESVQGRPLWECRWWSYDIRVQQDLRLACETAARGRASRYDAKLRMAGARLKNIDLTVKPLHDAEGNVTRILAAAVDITTRTQQEDELRFSATLLRAICEQTDDLVYVKDRAGRLIMANPALLELFGKSRTEVIGHTEAEFLEDPREAAALIENDTRVIATGRSEVLEETITRWGEARIWLSSKTPYRDAAGNVLGLIAIGRDITERRRAGGEQPTPPAAPSGTAPEAAPDAAPAVLPDTATMPARAPMPLEAVLRAMSDGVGVYDMQGKLVLANEAAARLLGLNEVDEVKRDIAHFCSMYELREVNGTPVQPDDRPSQRILRGETISGWELVVRHVNTGQKQILRFSGAPVMDEQGRQVLCVIVARDVTENKRAEQALRASEEHARTRAAELERALDDLRRIDAERQLGMDVLEHGEAVCVLDGGFRYVLVNRKHEQLMGLTRDKLLGRVMWDVLDESSRDAATYRRELERVMTTGVPAQFEDYHATRQLWTLVNVYPVQQEGVAIYTVGIGERKRAEEALRRADQQKDAFMAMVSHELRNPLSPIMVAAHILQSRQFEDAASRGAVEILMRQVRQMGRLLDDLLDVARITRNRLQLRTEVVDISQCVQDAVHSTQELIGEKEHELHLHLPREPTLLRGDPVRLTQVVTNLVNNAAKYCPPHSRIDVTLTIEGKDIVLRVDDNGPGIAAEVLPQIFSSFYSTPGTSDQRHGLGIGLWLVHRLVTMHRGSITVSNEPPPGAHFVIRLPGI